MMAEFQTPPTHSLSRVYTFYTCVYYCFPITGHVTVCYTGISDDQLQIAQARPPMFKHLSSILTLMTEI